MSSRIKNAQNVHNCLKSLKLVRKLKIIDSLIRCCNKTCAINSQESLEKVSLYLNGQLQPFRHSCVLMYHPN